MSNPFSTRFVRPGAIPYQFPAGVTVDSLVERLRRQQWRGAIVGPHGSGKSTLLATLAPGIEAAGRHVRCVSLHDGQRSMPADFVWPGAEQSPGVVVVDGYEQLAWWPRRRLDAACRRHGWGLMVTMHRASASVGLPELYRTSVDLETLERLVDRLLPAGEGTIRPEDVAEAFRENPQNMREALFALYDLFEQRRKRSVNT